MDDYFEEAAKIEAAEKGAKPGDIVIEPQQDFSHTISADAYGKGQKESRTGIYKPGGPTTFFGSDAVGPFRGEMSSTKKAMLARENLTEENWMHAAALSVLEANEELRRGRAERIVPDGGLGEIQVPFQHTTVTHYLPSAPPTGGAPVPAPAGELGEGGEVDTKTLEEANAASPRPLGVYEVHTGVIHCMENVRLLLDPPLTKPSDPRATQPTKARWVPVRHTKHRPVIGGLSSVGSAAWGVGWIEHVMRDEGAYAAELARVQQMEKEVENAEKNGPPAINMDWDV